MGDAHGDGRKSDGETPVHEVRLGEFSIDTTAVTDQDFAAFVDATGYETDAERLGLSYVFHLFVHAEPDDIRDCAPEAPRWIGVRGADCLENAREGPNNNGIIASTTIQSGKKHLIKNEIVPGIASGRGGWIVSVRSRVQAPLLLQIETPGFPGVLSCIPLRCAGGWPAARGR
jgi:hypothetical protein